MRLTFRQGIVKSAVDTNNNPTFLHKNTLNDFIALYVNASSIVITFAHGDTDYLYEEANTIEQAWGPFTQPIRNTYWLYWDINETTGIRTFGHTTREPIYSPVRPSSTLIDQHWFDIKNKTMKVYDGNTWIEKIRVFAGTFNGSVTHPEPLGSQPNINDECYAGFILFDDNDLPVVRSNNRKFLTTESQFYTTKSIVGTVSFDTVLFYAQAIEHIPQYSAVSYYNENSISLATYNDPNYKAAVGFIRTEVYNTEMTSVVTNGYVTNIEWDWHESPSTALYLGLYGTLQTIPPTSGFIQKVGTIVSKDTILVDIEPPIIYHNELTPANITPVTVDIFTGKLFTALAPSDIIPIDADESTPPPSVNFAGFTFVQRVPKMKWVLTHNLNTENVLVQVFDNNNSLLIPNSISILDANQIKLTFMAPEAGTAQVVLMLDASYVEVPDLNVPTFEHVQTIPSDAWVIDHDSGYYPIVRVYIDGQMVIPLSITHPSLTQTVITFVNQEVGVVRFV